jgi:hypothetical protein
MSRLSKRTGCIEAAGLTAFALAIAMASVGCSGDNSSTPEDAGTGLDAGVPGADATTVDGKANEAGMDATSRDSAADGNPGDGAREAAVNEAGPDAPPQDGASDATRDAVTDAPLQDALADAPVRDTAADAPAQDASADASPEAAAEAAADAAPQDATTDASDGGPGEDATLDASDAGGNDSGCSGATPVALTVKNYLSWCSVTVAGGAATAAASQTVCVAAGNVNVSAVALTGFELGPTPWHDTVGDHDGSGDPGTVTGTGQAASSTAMADATGASACVWACCPFANGTGCTNLTNQCP